MSKEISVDDHNKKVRDEIKKLKEKMGKLELTYMSEAEKPQASLLHCNKLARMAKKPQPALIVQKATPNPSL
jgi:hypothetical protein